MDMRFCKFCNCDHPITDEYWNFHRSKERYGKVSCCKVKAVVKKKEWYTNNLDKVKKYDKIKRVKDKDKIKQWQKLYQVNNKEKININRKIYILKNREKINNLRKINYHKNIDKYTAQRKLKSSIINAKSREKYKYDQQYKEVKRKNRSEWGKKNKDKRNEYSRNYHKTRRKTDIEYVIKANLRSNFLTQLKRVIRYNKTTRIQMKQKVGCVLSYIGMDMKDLIKYLESLWQIGMSWDTYGRGLNKWNIDHIYPLSRGDCTNPEFLKKVWHYTNLRPLWHIDNIKKGNKLI